MSILLDALRKSEKSQRRQGAGDQHVEDPSPAADVPRHRTLLVALVVLVGILVSWVIWREFLAPVKPGQAVSATGDTPLVRVAPDGNVEYLDAQAGAADAATPDKPAAQPGTSGQGQAALNQRPGTRASAQTQMTAAGKAQRTPVEQFQGAGNDNARRTVRTAGTNGGGAAGNKSAPVTAGQASAKQNAAQPAAKPGTQAARQPGTQQAKQPGKRLAGQPGKQQAGQPGKQLAGQPGKQPAGQPGKQQAGQSGRQQAGQPGKRPAGQPGKQPAKQSGGQAANQPTNRTAQPQKQAGQQAAQAQKRSMAAANKPAPKPKPEPIGYWELPDSVRNNLPEIKFTVLVYAGNPADRFVLVGGERLREGDRFPPDVLVQEIRRDGVVFKHKLYEFLVKR